MLNKKCFQFFFSNKSLPFLPRTLAAAASSSSSPLMAANSYLSPATFCGFSHLSEAKDRCSIQSKICFEIGSGSGLNLRTGLGLLRNNGVGIGRDHVQLNCAMARYKQSVNGSELFLVKNPDVMKGSVNGKKPLGFPGKPGQDKLVVAVDVDEVLGSFLSALNKFIADRCSWNHSVSEYHVYEFFKIWKCSRKEADILVHEFFKTHYFQNGIHPIPGAFSALQHLSSFCSLSVVTWVLGPKFVCSFFFIIPTILKQFLLFFFKKTWKIRSRQNAIRDHTLQWLEKHYPGLFEEIHFGNHFALDGQSKPKSEICRSLGAQFLIDDNPRYALECAEVGIKVLLFDYRNSYPWCKTGVEESHPLVTKVHNWQEVQQKLTSLVVSES